jgi:hypothetical protein
MMTTSTNNKNISVSTTTSPLSFYHMPTFHHENDTKSCHINNELYENANINGHVRHRDDDDDDDDDDDEEEIIVFESTHYGESIDDDDDDDDDEKDLEGEQPQEEEEEEDEMVIFGDNEMDDDDEDDDDDDDYLMDLTLHHRNSHYQWRHEYDIDDFATSTISPIGVTAAPPPLLLPPPISSNTHDSESIAVVRTTTTSTVTPSTMADAITMVTRHQDDDDDCHSFCSSSSSSSSLSMLMNVSTNVELISHTSSETAQSNDSTKFIPDISCRRRRRRRPSSLSSLPQQQQQPPHCWNQQQPWETCTFPTRLSSQATTAGNKHKTTHHAMPHSPLARWDNTHINQCQNNNVGNDLISKMSIIDKRTTALQLCLLSHRRRRRSYNATTTSHLIPLFREPSTPLSSSVPLLSHHTTGKEKYDCPWIHHCHRRRAIHSQQKSSTSLATMDEKENNSGATIVTATSVGSSSPMSLSSSSQYFHYPRRIGTSPRSYQFSTHNKNHYRPVVPWKWDLLYSVDS